MNSQKSKPFFLKLKPIANDFDCDIKLDNSSDSEQSEREYQQSMLELVAAFNQSMKNR